MVIGDARLRELEDAVNGLDTAAADDQTITTWELAKWRVFNAAVRMVKELQEQRAGTPAPADTPEPR